MAEVVVTIPTFRRPKGLRRLLDALAGIETDANVRVLVADNDARDRQGYDLCTEIREAYRFPLEAIVVRERGIAQARNALVARALEDPHVQFLAMLDDDEWPSRRWLSELLRVRRETDADAVEGAIASVFEGETLARFDGVARPRGRSGPVQMLQGAGNILLARTALESQGALWFDPAFALTGGEDKDFFVRLKRSGARFAWAAEALATTEVPASRMGLKWTLSRAFSVGNSDMRIFLKHESGLGAYARESAKIAGALLLSPALFLILMASPNRRARYLRKFFRAMGKLAALFGSTYHEYAVIHGE
jgi:glycosyltransferase involved in cell wall biosynthesis